MTNREFFVAIANNENIDVELVAKANELIASLDHKNELRKSSESKEKKEVIERRQKILNFFNSNPNEFFNRDEIAETLGITVGQVTSACSTMEKVGILSKKEIKVDKAKKMVYGVVTE